jgi:hypothetical protein
MKSDYAGSCRQSKFNPEGIESGFADGDPTPLELSIWSDATQRSRWRGNAGLKD